MQLLLWLPIRLFSPLTGFSIYKCNLGCRPQAHFHCFCEKLFLNRNQFVHHLHRKHDSDLPVRVHDFHDDAAQPQPPSPPSGDLSPSCATISDTLSSCEGGHAAAWTSDTPSNMVPWPATEGAAVTNEPGSAPSDESCQPKTGSNKPTVCPQGSMVKNKSCLDIHMKMKHKGNSTCCL